MNADDLLRKQLSALAVPKPDLEARDRALGEAVEVLHASLSRRTNARPSRRFFLAVPRWALAAGVATPSLFIAAILHFSVRHPAGDQPDSLAAERVLLQQMETLFGPQLDAVIEGPDDAPAIRLADSATAEVRPGLAQPVLVQFRRTDGSTVRVLSYSGRTVCVTLRGERVCFEPLVTGRDEVLLSGEMFCWTPGQTSFGWNGYLISARALPSS